MHIHARKLIHYLPRLVLAIGVVAMAVVLISKAGPTTRGQDAPTTPISHLGVATTDMLHLGPIAVDPGDSITALRVPAGRTFVLTDIVTYMDRNATTQGFYADYSLMENDQLKFRSRIPEGGNAGWSQHFTGGLVFAPGSTISIETASLRTAGRFYVQLLGYYVQ